ncbi:MAG: AsmA-like C-terminal domain-containing protein, partial [Candidatus Omnitrophota bacterium]|nr:AsmA-like C-terminal domain-containing protein [Candidatus Omnitrophota bacterium]
PYQLTAGLAGVKIEKLKLDTPLKDKDIAGSVRAGVKLSGFSGDLSKLNGAGEIFINDGKLWQLDLFKGVGSLIFVKDFANINFRDGSCAFFIKDKYIFTDNLKLASDMADLTGAVKINFDSTIDATLDVKVNADMVPLSRTFRDVTTAIAGEAVRFGTIKISGTLSAPKFKFQAAVVDIIKGLTNIFLKKQ